MQRAALATLVAAVESGRGFAMISGGQGADRAALLNTLSALLRRPPIDVIHIDPGGEVVPLRRFIGLVAGAQAKKSDPESVEQAQELLLKPQLPDTRALLLIDRAEQLCEDTLAYLQLIAGLSDEQSARLQIVFAGAPAFWKLLETNALRSLRERISVRVALDTAAEPLPLSAQDLLAALTVCEKTPAAVPRTGLVPAPEARAKWLRDLFRPGGLGRQTRRFGVASGIAVTVMFAFGSPARHEKSLPQGFTAARSHLRMPLPTLGPIPVASVPPPVVAVAAAAATPVATLSAGDPQPAPMVDPTPVAKIQGAVGDTPDPVPAADSAIPFVPLPIQTVAPSAQAASRSPLPEAVRASDGAPDRDTTVANGDRPASPATDVPVAQIPASGSAQPSAPQLEVSPPPATAALAAQPQASGSDPPRAPQPEVTLSPTMMAALLRYGNEKLRYGDVGAARLLFGRAAEAGSSEAATAMGKTYDPRFLSEIGARGIQPEPDTARDWYRKAVQLGNREAATLGAGLANNASK
jgi:TPR repeat protein